MDRTTFDATFDVLMGDSARNNLQRTLYREGTRDNHFTATRMLLREHVNAVDTKGCDPNVAVRKNDED
jgi:hypothetical protein